MKTNDSGQTIIAALTPPIGGSVSVLRISGPEAISTTNKFIGTIKLSTRNGGIFQYCTLKDPEKTIVDEVIVLVFKAPHSYTGEDVIEINSHANPFIVDKIISLYLAEGCRLAEPGEFTKRAFLNGKLDLVQAEAVADLIAAKSAAGVSNSLFQLKGRLSEKLLTIKKEIVNITSFLELELDFSEEDIEIISPKDLLNTINETTHTLAALIASFEHGKIISNGIKVLITGKPNVGKSSLMNALLGQNRVIVSDKPGTTRDLVREQMIINNTVIEFVDSAGIHPSIDSIESVGIDKARDQYDSADTIFLVVDISDKLNTDDYNLIKSTGQLYKQKTIIVGNKSDRPLNTESIETLKNNALKHLIVSAKTGQNLNQLKAIFLEQIMGGFPQKVSENLITNKRQYEQLVKTRTALQNAKDSLETNAGYEFIAMDMRDAIQHLSEISGEITSDDVLNNIFSSFCIGK